MQANWYFDYVSPYPYLHLARFEEFPEHLTIKPVPIVFGGLLKHWENRAPVDIPGKRDVIFRHVEWRAAKQGMPYKRPAEHPFNSLALLRLTVALGSDVDTVRTIATHIWAEGNSATDAQSMARLSEALGVHDVQALIANPAIKQELIDNGQQAIAAGVFGVPTYEIDGILFWGDESLPQLLDYAERSA